MITDRIENRLRSDYFTMTIYFRIFIPDMYPEYDKAIYIDSDIVVMAIYQSFMIQICTAIL